MAKDKSISTKWNKIAEKLLLGKKIVKVEYMSVKESEDMMWSYQPVCFLLNDGNWIFPMRDDEGNDAGALAVGNDYMLPVLRGDK
tara:strand:- start:1148 stop:1402 length:255 start_codon:yes stop_codon:yes gene_type:complete